MFVELDIARLNAFNAIARDLTKRIEQSLEELRECSNIEGRDNGRPLADAAKEHLAWIAGTALAGMVEIELAVTDRSQLEPLEHFVQTTCDQIWERHLPSMKCVGDLIDDTVGE